MKRVLFFIAVSFSLSSCALILNKSQPSSYETALEKMHIEKEGDSSNSNNNSESNNTANTNNNTNSNTSTDSNSYPVQSDTVSNTFTYNTDYHIYYFTTSSKSTNYKITRTEYSGRCEVSVSDDYAFYNDLGSISAYSTSPLTIKTNGSKRIYIKIVPYYIPYNGSAYYTLQVSAKTDTPINLYRYN